MRSSLNNTLRRGFALMSLLIIPSMSYVSHANKERNISIDNNKSIHLNHYKVNKVVDVRPDQSRVGFLRTAMLDNYLNLTLTRPLDQTLESSLKRNIVAPSKAEALTLYVYEYFAFERSVSRGPEVAVNIHFALYNDAGERLLDYYKLEAMPTGINIQNRVDKLLENGIENAMISMDNDMKTIWAYRASGKPIHVEYEFVHDPDNKALYCYNPQRPLTKFHFNNNAIKSDNKKMNLESGLIVSYQTFVKDGVPEVVVKLLPYFDMSKSWISSSLNFEKALQYAQTYFKFSAKSAREIVANIESQPLTLSEVKNALDGWYISATQDIKEQQVAFLTETNYNIDASEYDTWKRSLAITNENIFLIK